MDGREGERIEKAGMKRGEGETPQVASIKKITERATETEWRKNQSCQAGVDYRVKLLLQPGVMQDLTPV